MSLVADSERVFDPMFNLDTSKKVLRLLMYAAHKFESPLASMLLGAKYLKGDEMGGKQDNKVAFKWYLRAAAMENPIAQHKVAS